MELKKYATIHKLDKIENNNKKIQKSVMKVWYGIRLISECDIEKEKEKEKEKEEEEECYEFDEV
jgi:hypothetical protein